MFFNIRYKVLLYKMSKNAWKLFQLSTTKLLYLFYICKKKHKKIFHQEISKIWILDIQILKIWQFIINLENPRGLLR